MSSILESVDVDVPVRTAYDQWTQFEEFPRFMEGVKTVRQLDDTHLEWTAEVAGVAKHWKAEISEQTPDQRIAWHATDGAQNAGVVTFHRLDDEQVPGHPAAGRRARWPGRVGRRRARLRPAPGQGRPRTVQVVHRGPRRRHRRVAWDGRPARRHRLAPARLARPLQGAGPVAGSGRLACRPWRHWSPWLPCHWGSGSHALTPVRWPGSPATTPWRPAEDCYADARSEAPPELGARHGDPYGRDVTSNDSSGERL